MVKSGSVSLTKEGRVLEQAGPGTIFGELALIDREPLRDGRRRDGLRARLDRQAALLVPRAADALLR